MPSAALTGGAVSGTPGRAGRKNTDNRALSPGRGESFVSAVPRTAGGVDGWAREAVALCHAFDDLAGPVLTAADLNRRWAAVCHGPSALIHPGT
jgi:hypothetical protein